MAIRVNDELFAQRVASLNEQQQNALSDYLNEAYNKHQAGESWGDVEQYMHGHRQELANAEIERNLVQYVVDAVASAPDKLTYIANLEAMRAATEQRDVAA